VHHHFSAESRNVHLGLCTYGFNPFELFAAPYSCWSVILVAHDIAAALKNLITRKEQISGIWFF